MKTIAIIADTHLDHRIPEHQSYSLVKRFLAKEKPDEIVVAGDLMDFSVISRWNSEKPGAHFEYGKKYEISEDIALARKELGTLKTFTKKLTFLEGNHDIRLNKYKDTIPELNKIIDLKYLLEADKNGMEYISEIKQPYNIMYKDKVLLSIIHGWYATKYTAARTLQEWPNNIAFGHVHQVQSHVIRNQINGEPLESHSIGCLCDVQMAYCKGRPTRHVNGFGVAHFHKDTFTFNNIVIRNNSFIYNGRLYK